MVLSPALYSRGPGLEFRSGDIENISVIASEEVKEGEGRVEKIKVKAKMRTKRK
jgi:hypothetical protein